MLERILELCEGTEFLKADGFDEAIIGFDEQSERLIYSIKKAVEILERDMPRDEAYEHFVFNVQGSCMGPKTPIWCYDDL